MNTSDQRACLPHSLRQRLQASLTTVCAPAAVAMAVACLMAVPAQAQTQAQVVSPVAAAPSASAPTATPGATGQQTQACEQAVADNLRELRGSAAERIEFNANRRASVPTQSEEIGIKGAGRYVRGKTEVPFTYRCTINPESGEPTGVVVSDKPPAALLPAAPAPLQPDLTQLSPEACEAAVAADLKSRYPRVGRIVLGSDSRRLQGLPNSMTRLEGRGGVERAVGMNATPFKYTCDFDNRTGRITAVKTEL